MISQHLNDFLDCYALREIRLSMSQIVGAPGHRILEAQLVAVGWNLMMIPPEAIRAQNMLLQFHQSYRPHFNESTFQEFINSPIDGKERLAMNQLSPLCCILTP